MSEAEATALTLVHELIHGYYANGTGASHQEMALAAREAMAKLGIQGKMPPIIKENGDDNGSNYFDSALIKACSGW
jgi:hypothetical protein